MTRQALLHLRAPPTEVLRHTKTIRQERYAALFNNKADYRLLAQLCGVEHKLDLQWVCLVQESPMVHQSIGQSEIRQKTGVSVVGVVRQGSLRPNPDADFVLEHEDIVGIIGNDMNRDSFLRMA